MKKFMVGSCMMMLAVIYQSCGNNAGGADSNQDTAAVRDTVATAGKMDSANAMQKPSKPVDKDAASFAVNAANGGKMEVDLGNMAKEKASNPRVKNFGAMMVEDHTLANNDLKSLAASLNVSLSTDIGTDEKKGMDKLANKNGKDFDKAYMNMMLDDHVKDVAEFRKMADKGKDSTLKSFAARTLPVLLKHLDSARAITGKN